MRDVVLGLVFLAALPFAMRRTWIAVLLWTWISVMNPHKLAWGFAVDAPFAAAAAGAAFISLLWDSKNLRFPRDPAVMTLILFVVWMCVTTLFAFFVEPSLTQLNKIAKIQIMTLIAAAAADRTPIPHARGSRTNGMNPASSSIPTSRVSTARPIATGSTIHAARCPFWSRANPPRPAQDAKSMSWSVIVGSQAT